MVHTRFINMEVLGELGTSWSSGAVVWGTSSQSTEECRRGSENMNVVSLLEKSGWKAGRTATVSQTKCWEGSLVQGLCLIILWVLRA